MNIDYTWESVRPTENHLTVELIANESVTDGGILIPDTAHNRPDLARVLRVGPGKRVVRQDEDTGEYVVVRVPIDLKPGDVVLYRGYERLLSGNQRGKPTGGDVLLMTDDAVMAVLDGDDVPEYARR